MCPDVVCFWEPASDRFSAKDQAVSVKIRIIVSPTGRWRDDVETLTARTVSSASTKLDSA